jgi:hypothetical protein
VFGKVTDKETGLPVGDARLRFYCLDSLRFRFATTDAAGKYDFAGLVTGGYNVQASAKGYVDEVLGGTKAGDVRVSLHVSAAQSEHEVNLALTRSAAIAGKVTDAEGKPVKDCQVTALRRVEILPPVLWDRGGQGRTDESGRFEIRGLAADEYVIAATAPEEAAARYGAQQFVVHHGGGFSLARATPLVLQPGETHEGADVVLRGDDGKVLRGRVTAGADGTPAAKAYVQVSRRDHLFSEVSLTTEEDGTYRTAALGEGPYQVVVDAREQGLARLSKWIDFGEDDSEQTLDFALQPGATVSGWIDSDDGQPIPGDVKLDLWVLPPKQAVGDSAGWTWGGEDSVRSLQVGAQPEKRELTGQPEFEIPACCPGPSKLRVGCYSDDYFVKEIKLGNVDPRVEPMDLQPGETVRGIRVVLSKQGGALAGRATVEGTGEPVAYGYVHPALGDVKELAAYGRTVGDGSFRVRKLPPGEYFVDVSWKGDYQTVNRGPYRVEVGETTEVEIRVRETKGEKPATAEGGR